MNKTTSAFEYLMAWVAAISYANSKAKRVFETTELLEEILTNLSAQDLLLCQRTAGCFWATVQGSTKLRKKLFLAPDTSGTERLNPFLLCLASDADWAVPIIVTDEDQAMIRNQSRTDLILQHGRSWFVVREAPYNFYNPFLETHSLNGLTLYWEIREVPYPDEVEEEGPANLLRANINLGSNPNPWRILRLRP